VLIWIVSTTLFTGIKNAVAHWIMFDSIFRYTPGKHIGTSKMMKSKNPTPSDVQSSRKIIITEPNGDR
jgi:hypothetical protein